MSQEDFEGSLVLEKLAEVGRLEDFYQAIDSDNLPQIRRILKQAGFDQKNIEALLAMLD